MAITHKQIIWVGSNRKRDVTETKKIGIHGNKTIDKKATKKLLGYVKEVKVNQSYGKLPS